MAQIDWNGFLPQESGKALTWGAVCLTALVGAGWGLFSFGYTRGKDIGQDELSAYKAASEAKLSPSGDFDWSCETKLDSGFDSGLVVRKGQRHKP